MYTLKKQIIGVKSFLTYNNELYFEKDNDIYIDEKKSDLPELPRITKNGYLVINKGKNKFVIVQNNSVCTEYKNEKSIAYYINSFCLLSKSEAIGGIISYDNKLMKVIYENQGIYDITTGNLKSLFEIDIIFSFVLNTSEVAIFQNDATYIIGYSIKTNHPLWQFDLSQLGTFQDYNNEQQSYKVEKILGVHNEHLYVALNGSLLLELDIATGKITHKWHHLPEKYKEYPDDDFSARLFDLDQANNALVCLSGRRYDSIDLQTKEYNSVYIGEELKKYDIVSIRHQGDFTNEHISAVAHLKNDTWFQDGIVMFNRKTNKIDFFYKDETFTTGTATPKLAGNKLYQLDLDGNLYIFEKEENNIQT